MATTPAPQLGYGQRAEAPIDSVNQWMRGQPWYQNLIRSFGQDPNNVNLSDAQKQQVIRAAQANGVVVDEGNNGQEVDDSGNFKPKSHNLRNTLIVAGIAATALTGLGAAGIGPLSGALGGAAGGSAALPAATVPGYLGGGAATTGTVAGTAGSVGAGTAAAGGGSALGANLLRYALPVGANLASTVIQSKATTAASDAQQKYLEEALNYEKEKDAYDRKTNQDRYDYGKNLEASRYGNYSSNIAPFVATGTSANSRMASLLGLQPNAPAAAAIGPMPSSLTPTNEPPPYVPAAKTTQPMARDAGPLVTVASPDGESRQVPQSAVAELVRRGGRVIGATA